MYVKCIQVNSLSTVRNDQLNEQQCPAIEGFQAFNSIGLPNLDISVGQEPGEVTVDSELFDLTKGYVTECLINAAFNSYILPFETYRLVSNKK